jgi:tRNA(Ile)-lysidine synthase
MAIQPKPLVRRCVTNVLQLMLGDEVRVESASVQAVVQAYDGQAPVSGYTANIQGDLAVSANKRGVRIEPMSAFRARRKR